MKRETIYKLAQEHQECLPMHQDIKELIPEEDAQALLNAGFTDCSWGNDEIPSYYHPKRNGEAVLYAMDDVDDEGYRISGKITYYINGYDIEFVEYSNIADVISAYEELNK